MLQSDASGSIQHSKMSRPRSGSRPLTSSFASSSPASVGDLRWRTFARPAFAVGIRALRDGSFDTLTIAIFDQFQSTFNGPAANTPAGILALLCLAPLGRGRYLRLALAARENHDG